MENENGLDIQSGAVTLESGAPSDEENEEYNRKLIASLDPTLLALYEENKNFGLSSISPENSVMEGELDFEDEVNDSKGEDTLKENVNEDVRKESFASTDFEVKGVEEENQMSDKEDGQLSPEKDEDKEELVEEGKDDGELSDDDDLEEGEVKDSLTAAKQQVRQVCRFFNRGQCTWGNLCRFLHLSINDHGNYNMFAPNSKPTISYIPHGIAMSAGQHPIPVHVSQRSEHRNTSECNTQTSLPFQPSPLSNETTPPVESAWERGLRHAKEMVKKASRRKEQEPDFEEKRLNLGLEECHKVVPSEYDKENDYGKTSYRKQNDAPFSKFEQPPALYDKSENEAKVYWHGGQYENFEIQWGNSNGSKCRRGKESVRDTKISAGEKQLQSNKWHDEHLSEIQTTRSRADEWKDPWRRSKTPKGRRSRKRSHRSYSSVSSHSYSERSSHSSYSYSRSSSRSSFYSSRRSSSRSCSATRTPSRSRSRSYSRSLSMDSVSSASSSISQSSSRSDSAPNQNIDIASKNIDIAPRGGISSQNVDVNPPNVNNAVKKAEPPVLMPGFTNDAADKIIKAIQLLPDAETIKFLKALDMQPTNLENTSYTTSPTSESVNNIQHYEKDKMASKQELGVDLQRASEITERPIRVPPKSPYPKPQIKLTLLNKASSSKFPVHSFQRQPEFRTQHAPRIDDVPKSGIKRPLSPGNCETTVKEKKSTSSRRDELLKQLKAVEDAIARKRSKFFD